MSDDRSIAEAAIRHVYCRPPDEGELDYRTVFAEIDRLGWPGFVGAEYRPRTTTDAGLGWLRTLGAVS